MTRRCWSCQHMKKQTKHLMWPFSWQDSFGSQHTDETLIKGLLYFLRWHPHARESPSLTWPWASEVWTRARLQFGETDCKSVLLLHLSIHYSSLPPSFHPSVHPSFLAVGHFSPSGTPPCIMQQRPYHSHVIDIPCPAQLIARKPVKQTRERGDKEKMMS